jgi:amino acid adenylation domain-containing protein
MSVNKRIEKVYPLSPMQSGMFFHSLKNEQSRAYFQQIIFKIRGKIDRDLLQQSFDLVIERYDILRTVFRIDKLEQPMQFVLKQRNFRMEFEDISHMKGNETGIYLEEFAKKDKARGFDLTRDMLMRVFLFKTGPGAYVLVWSFHHILMDGWCLGIIYKDLNYIYQTLKQGKPIRMEPVFPYANYIKWLEGQEKTKGLQYWEKYLEGYDRQASLPKLANQTPQDYRLEEYDLVIAEKEIAALNTIARKNRVTINTVFQTLWGILLQKYTNSDDVVFGVVVSGRPPQVKGVEQIVGLFINTVPLRIKNQPDESFAQLLKNVHENTIQAKNHEYLSLAEIQSKTQLKGNLIDHIMAFENLPFQEEIKNASRVGGQEPGEQLEVLEVAQTNHTNYDFNVIIVPQQPFIVKFNYNSFAYDKEFIERLGLHLQEMIKQTVENPAVSVKKIAIITTQEKQQVLYDFNRTSAGCPGEKTIHELFAGQAERTPDNIAVVASAEIKHRSYMTYRTYISYRQLHEKSDRLAGLLIEKGVQTDTIVGIMPQRSPEMLIGILAILKAGGAYLPIDPEYPQERIDFMLKDSNAQALVVNDTSCASWLSFAPKARLNLSKGHHLNFPASQLPSFPASLPSSLSYIIYTSGTTGKPKGVMIQHRNVVRLMVNDRFQFDFNDNDVWTLFHSICFDFSVWEMYGALLYGGKLIVIPKMAAKDTGTYLEILKKQKVTVLNQTPSAFYALIELDLKNLKRDLQLRWIIFGGEALNPGKLKEWKVKYPETKLINMYGITETTVHVTLKEIGDREIKSNISSIGKPIPTLKVYVIDKYSNLQPIGIAGELCVAGAGVARGYLNRPVLTSERFCLRRPGGTLFEKTAPPGPPRKNFSLYHSPLYHSGDLARWLPNGDLEYLGRIDHQVQLRGFRVELGEIENRLLNHEKIKEAVVITKDDETGDKYLCAYFIAENEIAPASLKEYLQTFLPDYMVPSYFIQLEKIPLTVNGKLDRKALPQPRLKPGKHYTPPRNEIEKELAEIWLEVLEPGRDASHASPGIDDNFFESGGHSLKAAVLISKIHKALDVKIPLTELFIKPTIRELSRYIETNKREKYFSITAAECKEYYPAASAQERLYLLQNIDQESTVYHISTAFILEGNIEKSKLEETFNKLIHRYESLRTSFHMIEGEPVQMVHDKVDFHLECCDLKRAQVEVKVKVEEKEAPFGQVNAFGGYSPKSQALRAKSFISSFIRPFDLSRPPLIRVGLIEETKRQYILIIDMHHIITDGMSMGLLIKDFMTLYREEPLPALHLQYKDYSQWQVHLMKSEIIKHQETYWINRFTGEIPVLNLPTDYPKPAIRSFAGSALTFTIGKNDAHQLKKLALQEEATLFMVLLAIFNVFLAKLSGQEHIVVGTPTSGRGHADLEKIIGMFVNTLPLVNFPRGQQTFREFLKEVGKQTLQAFANQDYQFEDLVDKVVKDRDTSRGPLFDVMLALQNMETSTIEIPGLELKPYPLEIPTSKFDITFNGIESEEGIHFTVEYCTKLFKKEIIERWTRYFNRVMTSILEDKEKKIGEIDIITDQERRKILFEFNNTKTNYPKDKTVLSLLADQLEKVPENIAIIAPCLGEKPGHYGQITYREMHEKSHRLANRLQEKGIGPDTIVAIMMERSMEMVIGFIGIMKAGGAYLPIAPDDPEARIKYMLKDSGAGILLKGNAVEPGKSEIRISKSETNPNNQNPNDQNNVSTPIVLNFEHLNFEFASNFEFRASNLNSSKLAYVIYTSGSTGKPKGVLVEHRSLFNVIYWRKLEFNLETDDNVLQLFSITFDGFISSFFVSIVSGSRAMLLRDEESNDVLLIKEVLTTWKVTHFVCTPSLYASLLEVCSSSDLAGLWGIGLGGETLKPSLIEKSKHLAPWMEMTNEYGPTEITIFCTLSRNIQPGPVIPIGKPIANTAIYILDPYNHLLPIGIPGELCVSGIGITRGYLNQPTLTAEKFIDISPRLEGTRGLAPLLLAGTGKDHKDHMQSCNHAAMQSSPHHLPQYPIYKTGDLSRWLPDGNIQFLGRIDTQVKIRGFRIEPGEIENQLLKHENIKEAVVIERQAKDGTAYLCAYWVSNSPGEAGKTLTITRLREFLSGKLAAYMIPSYFVQLETIPLTPSGKINRESLPEPDIANIKLDSTYTAPGDHLEQLIADTWKQVLNLEKIGTHDNFFDLGGNSLKILQVNQKLNQALGIRIPAVYLFKYPNISTLKSYLQQERPGIDVPTMGIATGKQQEQKTVESADIAVIGMAGRFPGANNIRQFWENLKNGIETIWFFTTRELEESGETDQLLADPGYINARAVIADKDRFDAGFFNYSPQEARIMDPQVRLFHECAWETLEDAGYNPETYDKPIGLYAGAASSTGWEAKVLLFARQELHNAFEAHQLVNSYFIPTRISYKLNLKGPAVFIHTACSTSLTAIHTACNALLLGDCTMALAGGVSVSAEKKSGYLYQEGLVMSSDGHCRAFDAQANGTVGGEGAAVVLLKPLEQARADNDHVYAVIKASAANNDGTRKVGFSAPSIDGQAEAIANVYRKAKVPPESITYIETHGTGTTLGDPIELAALNQAFNTQKKNFCTIGSLKSNMGHLDTAAGVASFIKVALALTHKQIPPTLHFMVPNPQTDLIDSPFYVNTNLAEWEPGPTPRRAGISSFGIGGTNVHIVLEEARGGSFRENRPPWPPLQKLFIILLSAKTAAALLRMTQNLAEYLNENRSINLADIAYTLQMGRKSFNHRWMTVCSTVEQALETLTTPGKGETHYCPPGEEKLTPLIFDTTGDKAALLEIGRQWLHGQEIDWKRFYTKEKPNRLPLPTYPFEGQQYWIEGHPFKIESLQQLSRETQPLRQKDIGDWFYFPRWIGSTPAPSQEKDNEPLRFLVFINDESLVDRLVKQLHSTNTGTPGTGDHHTIITASPGNSFKKKGNHEFEIDPHNSSDYHSLFKELEQLNVFPHRIIHTWNVTPGDYPGETGVVGFGFYSLLYIARAIGKQEFTGEIRLDVITTNIQEVHGNEPLAPAKAVVLGPLKVIPQEYPFIICRSIDIELPPPGTPQEEMLVRCLIDECSQPLDAPDIDIAYRNLYRWTKTYEPVRLPAPGEKPLQLRERGVYLITGGTGDIGFTLAEYMLNHFQARLILIGSTSLPAREEWDHRLHTHDENDYISRKIAKIRQLEAAKGEILVWTADVGDEQAMKNIVREAEQTFGPINGVIHAAGITTGKSVLCPIEEISEKEWNRQFRPKIQGTLVLAELFKDKPLDFCILTSSLSEILGGLGFAAYSAANAFMDVFAHLANRGKQRISRWISVNWGDWEFKREIGIETNLTLGASTAESIITAAQGVETFKRILTLLQTPARQVVVSAGNLQTRIDRWVKPRSLRKSDAAAIPSASSRQYQPRPRLSTGYTAPCTPSEQAIVNVWQNQFGYEPIGIHDDFFELGGDSLKAISMLSKVHKELNVKVKLNEFFTRPFIETLVHHAADARVAGYASIRPVEKKDYYPLSSVQKRLYVLDQMGTLGTSYNLSMAFLLEGELQKERLEKVFTKLVKRHESFRTSFAELEGEPLQRIHDEVEFGMEYKKVEVKEEWPPLFEGTRGLAPLSNEASTHSSQPAAALISSLIRPFDLTQAPLLRVGLLEIAEARHILIVDMHHIIFDGVSQQIFFKEFAAWYDNQVLPRLRLQYKDYAEWQHTQPQQEEIKKQETYWLNELAGELPVLELPADNTRPMVFGFEGGALEWEMNREETDALNDIARSAGATLFMVLLAGYNIFLTKITGQEDILVGTPTAGRSHSDLEPIVGMFVNTLVLRNYLHSQETFLQFLGRVKEKTLEVFENQDYPFENLVEKLAVERDTSRNPLFDVVFVLQDVIDAKDADKKIPAKELQLTPVSQERTTSQFDLVLEAVEQEQGLYFSLQYYSKLFRKGTIERFIIYLKTILTTVIRHPHIKLSEIQIISWEERKQVLENFNAPAGGYPTGKTLTGLFAEQLERTPDNIAVTGSQLLKHRSHRTNMTYITYLSYISYRQLNQKSNRLAHLLCDQGVKPGDIVGLMVERSLEMIIGILGILKAGCAYLPINPAHPQERIEYMLKDSGAKILLKDKDITPQAFISPSTLLPFYPSRPSNLAYIIYTSGTTGQPKGVPITHANLSPLLHWGYRHIGIDRTDRAVQNLSYYFDWSVWEIFITLTSGASLYMIPNDLLLDAGKYIEFMNIHDITVLHVTPTHYRYLVQEKKPAKTLKYLFIGAEQLNHDLVRQSFEKVNKKCRVFNMYGPTEATIISAVLEIKREEVKNFENLSSIPIGTPMANTPLLILDKDYHLCPVNIAGQLYIGGDGLAPGYLNNPELSSEKFINHKKNYFHKSHKSYTSYISYTSHLSYIYQTGDLARWLPDGNIEFIGRVDTQVKIRGFRIEIGEIESRLQTHAAVRDAIVVTGDDAAGNKYLCAYVVLETGDVKSMELREYLARMLPDYMVPSYYITLDKIPLNPNGKIDRKALPAPTLETGNRHTPPRDNIERKLAEIWSEILRRDASHASQLRTSIGIDDNFFELGGHSLKATTLASRIQKTFDIHLPLTEVFRAPTIREMGQYINQAVKEKYVTIEPGEKREHYALSSAQKRLYILQQMTPDSTAYNIPQMIPLDSNVSPDREKLEQILQQLISRHESLRTSFHMVDDQPIQRIHHEVEYEEVEVKVKVKVEEERPPVFEGTRGLVPLSLTADRATQSAATTVKNFIRPFNLSQAPLLRVGLMKIGTTKHLLLMDMHHIISDGVSMQLLIKEFTAIYHENPLPVLRIQYKDFARWQNRQKIKEALKKQETYWLKVFADEIPVLNLPVDYPRPALQNFAGNTHQFEINPEETLALKKLAREKGVTLYMVLLAITTLLMSRLSRQEDIIIGTPIAGRRHADLENIIGMFVNTLVIRNWPISEKSFEEFLTEVKDNTLAAYENQDYQFEDLVEKVDVKRDTGRNPLFDVMIAMQNTDEQEISGPNPPQPDKNFYDPGTGVSKFDLTLQAADTGTMLLLSIQYAIKLFKPGTIQGLIDYFKRIVTAVLADPEQRLNQVDILADEEKHQLLHTFNDTAVDYPLEKTLHEYFQEQAEAIPDRTALHGCMDACMHEVTYITYGELHERSTRLALFLKEKGTKPGTIVPIMMERSPAMIIGILAILKAGGAYLPIDPQYPEERIKYILKDSGAKILVTDPGLPGKFEKLLIVNCQLLIVNEIPPNRRRLNNPPKEPNSINNLQLEWTNLAYILYTSGSTGKPKGVMIRHYSINNLVRGLNDRIYYRYNETLKVALIAPIQFDASVKQIFAALLQCHSLFIVPGETRTDSEKLLEFYHTHQIDISDGTPMLLRLLLAHSTPNTLKVKHFLIGGEPLPQELVKAFFKRFSAPNQHILRITNVYGPTECSVDSTSYEITPDNFLQYHTIPIGKPMPNVNIYILDHDKILQPVGVPGKIYISGAGVAAGYLNNPELTAEKFCLRRPGGRFLKKLPPWTPRKNFSLGEIVPTQKVLHRFHMSYMSYISYLSYYQSGDLARWLPDGNIEFLGRIDHQVKIRGYRIELEEIEKQLMTHPKIKESVVIDHVDTTGDKHLCAYFVTGHEITPTLLKEYLLTHLPDYMVPLYFIQVEKIPITANGKLDRKALPRPRFKLQEDYTAPRNEIEKELVKIWVEVLYPGRDASQAYPGLDDNFFALGGHSLKAAILISKIHKHLDVKIPLGEIFKTPTIRALSRLIQELSPGKYSVIQAAEKKEYYPLSSAQKRLYFLQQMDPNSRAYNMPYYIPVGNQPVKHKLENAFKKLLNRHESLRTSFVKVKEESVQKVHEQVEFSLEFFEAKETREIIKNFQGPFDLRHAPLLRAGLIELDNKHYIIMIELHHIISDGTSTTILFDDLKRFYSGGIPQPLEIQYKDFSGWQGHLFSSGQIKNQENYWLDLYQGEIPRIHLPVDFERPGVFTFAGSSYLLPQEQADMAAFKALTAAAGATLYMNTLAALNVLFYKTSGQADIIIGTGIAGRPHAQLQGIIGMFVNTLAMRNYPNGEKSYETLLKEVIQNSIKAFENQDVQFEELVDQLDLERDPSRNPLFDTFMLVQNFRKSQNPNSFDNPPPYLPSIENQNPTSKFDLSFYIIESEQDIYINIEYYTAIFKEETIRRLGSYFNTIIKTVIQNPALELKHIDIIPTGEKQQILYEFNDTARDYPRDKTIHELFTARVEKSPHGIAAVQGERMVTYLQLDKRSNQLAHFLKSYGKIETEDRVGILMNRSLALIESILGILKAGAAYVPISANFPGNRIKTIINDSGIGFIISGKKNFQLLSRLQWECNAFHGFLCMDSKDIYSEEEEQAAGVMDEKLWDYVGETGSDNITAGGWQSSYTGEPLSKEEMEEYKENIYKKLFPLLHKKMRVLEIGCSTGISMYRLAPKVNFYHGTDLSGVIIQMNKQQVKKEGHKNITLTRLAAHEIDKIKEKDFDLVILNSVVQYFYGYNYLRKIIRKAIGCLKEQGYLFFGDIMDPDLKEDLTRDLVRFKQANSDKPYKTKTDWSAELFVSRGFFADLSIEFPGISNIEFSRKIHTIENELTRYRYDALITVHKSPKSKPGKGAVAVPKKQKNQYDLTALDREDTRALPVQVTPDHAAYVIYTSGSTGKPRGVIVEHGPVVNLLNAVNTLYNFACTDVFLLKTSYVFDVSITELFGWFLPGSRMVVLEEGEEKDPAKILETAARNCVTNINFVPSMYRTFLDYTREMAVNLDKLSAMKYIFLAGEALPPALVTETGRLNQNILLENIYGPTEAAVYASSYSLSQWSGGNWVPIGKPLPNVEIYILDRYDHLQPVGVPGELCITGVCLARGYLNQPGLTAERFCLRQPGGALFEKTAPPGPPRKNFPLNMSHMSYMSYMSYIYRTGDLARWLADGNIQFLGRMDNQVKIRGYRIELGEIENQLRRVEAVKDAVVIDCDDQAGDKYLCAYIVPVKSIDMAYLKDELSGQLPGYMVPAFFAVLKEIPLTSSGKIDRRGLPTPGPGREQSYTPPRDHIENQLAVIWQEVLGLESRIGIDDNFFEAGGHSLKATVMTTKIHKILQVNVPLAEVFKTPSIRGLAGYIRSKAARQDRYTGIESAEAREYYVLSSIQKRIYFLQQMDEKGIAYNMPVVFMLEGNLDIGQLEKAFKALSDRHESLRTSFHLIDGNPIQEIHRHVQFEIEYYDMKEVEIEAKVKVKEERPPRFEGTRGLAPLSIDNFIRPFDLSRAPLLRVGLIKHPHHTPAALRGHPRRGTYNSQEGKEHKYIHILLVDMHHIICDGVSINILVKEFSALYENRSLPGLRLQYKDYSQWQEQPRVKAVAQQQENFWLKEFAGEIPVLNLPLDFPRPLVQDFAGDGAGISLDSNQSAALKSMAASHGITLYMLLYSLFSILLAKLTGQEDIIMGTPVAARRHADLEPIIGMFVNTLALRSFPAANKTLEEFFKEVKESALEAFENQEYPFEELVEKVTPDRDTSRNPLFDAMFVFQPHDPRPGNNPGPKIVSTSGSLAIIPIEYQVQTAKFDITPVITEMENTFQVTFEYCTRLFKPATIERFLNYFQRIINSVVRQPGQGISEIDILPEEEKKLLLNTFNDTRQAYPHTKTIHELFAERVERTPDHIAVEGSAQIKNRTHMTHMTYISYRQLHEKSNQLEGLLIEKGVQSDTIVAIMMKRCVEMIIGLLGILKAGGAYLPIDPDYPQDRISYMLNDSNATILLTEKEITHWQSPTIHPSTPPSFYPSTPSNLAYILYTSGSTGRPKGVLVGHRSVVRLVKNTNFITFSPRDRLLQTGALDFDASTFEIWGALLNGITLCLISKEDLLYPPRLKITVREKNITIMWMTAPLFNRMLQEDMEIFNGLESLLVGGDVLSPHHIRQVKERYPQLKVINGYGPTENTTFSTTYPVELPITGIIPIGKPIANSTAYILDKYGHLVPVGVPGELVVGGDGVARGYLNNPELTAERFCLRRGGGGGGV